MDDILEQVLLEVFNYKWPYGFIGLSDKNGLSSYYSGNMKETDVQEVNQFMESIALSPLNSRAIKTS